MISPTTSISVLWGVWLVGWVVTSRLTAKTLVEPSGNSQLSYLVFLWAGAILLFFHPGGGSILQRFVFPRRSMIGWIGVAGVAFGLGYAGWARYHLGRLWSGRVTLKEDHAIIRTGPYGIVRHPIYTGLVLALIGSFIAEPTLAALVGLVALTIGLVIKIRQEEALLTKHFGVAYDEYRKDVPALIPYVW